LWFSARKVFVTLISFDFVIVQVQAVEDEMRMLLKEVDSNKKATEDKIKQLTKAFLELQENI
jgi:hypothetical protein